MTTQDPEAAFEELWKLGESKLITAAKNGGLEAWVPLIKDTAHSWFVVGWRDGQTDARAAPVFKPETKNDSVKEEALSPKPTVLVGNDIAEPQFEGTAIDWAEKRLVKALEPFWHRSDLPQTLVYVHDVGVLMEEYKRLKAKGKRLLEVEKNLDWAIRDTETEWASEKLSGNIVKENYAKGHLSALLVCKSMLEVLNPTDDAPTTEAASSNPPSPKTAPSSPS